MLFVGLVVDELVRRRAHGSADSATPVVPLVLGVVATVAGLVLSYGQAAPPGDAGVYRSWNTSFDSSLLRTSLAAISACWCRSRSRNASSGTRASSTASPRSPPFSASCYSSASRGCCGAGPAPARCGCSASRSVIGFLYSKIQFGSVTPLRPCVPRAHRCDVVGPRDGREATTNASRACGRVCGPACSSRSWSRACSCSRSTCGTRSRTDVTSRR